MDRSPPEEQRQTGSLRRIGLISLFECSELRRRVTGIGKNKRIASKVNLSQIDTVRHLNFSFHRTEKYFSAFCTVLAYYSCFVNMPFSSVFLQSRSNGESPFLSTLRVKPFYAYFVEERHCACVAKLSGSLAHFRYFLVALKCLNIQ